MAETPFKTAIEPANQPSEPKISPKVGATTPIADSIEVPYMDYQSSSSHPFSVDYFKLGDTWSEPLGGFPREVSLIESYVKDKINSGDIPNSQSAVKELLKGWEKLTNISKEERAVVKIETIAAHIEFLRKTEQLKSNLRRYRG